ncbi:hypothetical protein [Lonsdalea quercina]|uniref:hypothetical protein n=1 Tax=Lonsdalea quercina TaxID=71657 RepID=UPI003975E5B4
MQNNHVIPLHDDFDEWWTKESYDEQVKFMSLVMRKRIKSNMRKAYKAGKASSTRGDVE